MWHVGRLTKGQLKKGQKVKAKLDVGHRIKCMQNHTATHLLNAALHKLLPAKTMMQMSSLVTYDHFNFEFTAMNKAIDAAFISDLEEEVNAMIGLSVPVSRKTTKNPEWNFIDDITLAESISRNLTDSNKRVITLPDEEYPEKVHLIQTPLSVEPCCGTHVLNTADVQVCTRDLILEVPSCKKGQVVLY